jgi:hypothetical protein
MGKANSKLAGRPKGRHYLFRVDEKAILRGVLKK